MNELPDTMETNLTFWRYYHWTSVEVLGANGCDVNA
jgi:hypothetical protein